MRRKLIFGVLFLGALVTTVMLLTQARLVAQPGGGMASPRLDASGASAEAQAQLVASSNAFARDLYGALKGEGGNAFVSPWSITTALAMTYEGARGQTATELERVFGLPADAVMRQPAFAALHNALNPQDAAYQLSVANALWAQQGYAFRPEYVEVLRRRYGSEATTLDIAGAPEQTRETINAWVAGKTNDKIKDLFPPNSFGPLTRLVLTNAVYFKGKWDAEFDPALTQDEDFRAPGGAVKVPLMRRMGTDAQYAYTETDDLQVLELPYQGDRLSMLVLLPKGTDDLAPAEAALEPTRLAELRGQLHTQQVHVYLPRFTFSSKYMLNEQLQQLGMPTAFTDAADFSGMDGAQDLFIGLVVHQAFVDVNEEGTEAAAATGVAMETTAVRDPLQYAEFRADHPFLFAIVDRETGLVLFLGRVEDPTA